PGIFSVFRMGAKIGALNPILPGDDITIIATGLGSVIPAVASGQPGPSDPLATAVPTPVVKVACRPARVTFAGLAPGFVGVYQINASVPLDLANPSTEVTVEPSLPVITGPPGPVGPRGPPGSTGATGP